MGVKTVLSGFLIFAALGAGLEARISRFLVVELIDSAPLVVEATVTARSNDVATLVVNNVIKGDSPAQLQLADIPRRLPDIIGLSLEPGERVLLFLSDPSKYFAFDQSKIDLSASPRLVELVRRYVELAHDGPTARIANNEILRHMSRFNELSDAEKEFLLQVSTTDGFSATESQVRALFNSGLTDASASVRWQTYLAARSLGMVASRNREFVIGLSDHDARVRAISFDALRELVGDDFGYDPTVRPEEQQAALERWQEWLENR